MIAAFIYLGASKTLKYLEIDDPLDAAPIHAGCGTWGVLSAGIFGTDENAALAGYAGSASGAKPLGNGSQFGVQLIGVISIMAWTIIMSGILFKVTDLTVGLRASEEEEVDGLDASEHGAVAYIMGPVPETTLATTEASEIAPMKTEADMA